VLGTDAGELGSALFWQPTKPDESNIARTAKTGSFIIGLVKSRTFIMALLKMVGLKPA